MAPRQQAISNRENFVLASLPRRDYDRILATSEPVPILGGEVLTEASVPVEHVYFPRDAIISLIAVLPDGSGSQVAMVGHEGMAGVAAYFGGNRAVMRTVVQGTGTAVRMKVSAFRQELSRSTALRQGLGLYAQALFTLAAQSSACNLLHPIDGRLCRWLLMTHDRAGADRFLLTQEVIAGMLGVHRPTITAAARKIQDKGHIRYRRGKIDVLDREGLEACACACYGLIRDEFVRLLGWPRRGYA